MCFIFLCSGIHDASFFYLKHHDATKTIKEIQHMQKDEIRIDLDNNLLSFLGFNLEIEIKSSCLHIIKYQVQ